MKKIISIILSFCLLMTVTIGCGVTDKPSATAEKISVVSTIFPPYDFVREIAGDEVDLTMLLPPASESHSYEPTPQDIIKIQNCNVFIYVGGDSDAWVRNILSSIDTSKMEIITLMDCVDVVEEEIIEGMDDDYEHEHEFEELGHGDEHEYDEHVWTSPKNAMLIVQKITDVLCNADNKNAAAYQRNAAGYLTQLDDLDKSFKAVVQNAARKTIVFGDRFPFRYFSDEYGLSYFAAFPGCSTETEASAATVAFLITKVESEKIPVIFHAELSNQNMANTISEATGAKVLQLHACHNVTKAEFESNEGYLSLMNQNVNNLKEALH